jgi:hypothetical protein
MRCKALRLITWRRVVETDGLFGGFWGSAEYLRKAILDSCPLSIAVRRMF